MKKPSNMPILRATNEEVLPGDYPSKVILSSARTKWKTLLVEEHRVASLEWDGGTFVQHVVAVNVGRPVTSEVKKGGRFRRVYHKTGSISLFPGHRPFFSRIKKDKNGSADALFIALAPVFLDKTAAELEIYPDRVQLTEQRGINDPVLRHIAMALRNGIQTGRSDDPMYGEGMSIALAVHLLREYGGVAASKQSAEGGLSREKLMDAIEYIQAQLETGLTVSRIAGVVHMSPYHFARLFKKSTGQSPYRYVIQARANRAKELLTSGKFSVIEIAHRLGFADQSHLTRQFKNIFGVTPRILLAR